jgi:hypothetical protein
MEPMSENGYHKQVDEYCNLEHYRLGRERRDRIHVEALWSENK